MRDVLDAILYIASAGCAWRMLPNDFPPVSTVRYYFHGWRNDGIFEVSAKAQNWMRPFAHMIFHGWSFQAWQHSGRCVGFEDRQSCRAFARHSATGIGHRGGQRQDGDRFRQLRQANRSSTISTAWAPGSTAALKGAPIAAILAPTSPALKQSRRRYQAHSVRRARARWPTAP